MKAVILSALLFSSLLASAAEPPKPPFPLPEGVSVEEIGNYFFGRLYAENCAVCHGEKLEGAAQGTPLVGVELNKGDSLIELKRSISDGAPGKGMPAWSETLDKDTIDNIAFFIIEQRAGYDYDDFNYSGPLTVPTDEIATEKHSFRFEPVITGLDPLPYSIAPLPDGRILLTEKKRGLSIISADGKQSALVSGAPKGYDDTYILGMEQEWGVGWVLDVALHPDFEKNGWIYLSYGDRCENCNKLSRAESQPVSMVRVIRGRLKDDRWVDEEMIWQADIEHYSTMTDIVAGARICFDETDHLFFSVGMKGVNNHVGVQDLDLPWGKTHRVFDDGRVPTDNPYSGVDGALQSIWTRGHRSPQGLEYRASSGQLWGTEMGPRGGDEVNLLKAGGNYGWPLYSLGRDYDGTPVNYGKELGIEFELKDIEQPVVDLTPSPAVSSFIFYDGDTFPAWQGNMLVGALKDRSLTRMVLAGDTVIQRETLFQGVARMRDIETGPDGELYVLFEHNSGGQIVRLVPTDAPAVR